MLTYVEEAHRIHMSQILEIVRSTIAPLTLLEFLYADDPCPELVSKVSVGTPHPQQLVGRARRKPRRHKLAARVLLKQSQILSCLFR